MNYIVLDVETPNGKNDSICSIGVELIDDDKVTDEWYTLVDPEEEFESMNIAIHHITPGMVQGAPKFEEVWARVAPYAATRVFVAHNAEFDLTVLAKALTLFLVALVQALLLTAGFVRVIHVPQNDLLMDTNWEIYVTVLLIIVSSAAMGLLISAALKSSESAILFVLVLIIAQVVFSGALFNVTGAMTAISYLVVCRWGMGALGASTDLNSRLVWLNVGLDSPMYDATVPNLVHSWQMMWLITVVCLLAAWLVLKAGFARRKG